MVQARQGTASDNKVIGDATFLIQNIVIYHVYVDSYKKVLCAFKCILLCNFFVYLYIPVVCAKYFRSPHCKSKLFRMAVDPLK